MTAILIPLLVTALVVHGLQRNHRRQLHLGTHLAGSSDVEDRDLPRVRDELHATAVHTVPNRRAPRWSTRSVWSV